MSFITTIKNTISTPTEKDINRKFMYRYFASKANLLNTQIFEISRRDYERYENNQFIITGHLKWLIVGKLEDMQISVYTGNPTFEGGREPITIPGILTQNEAAVKFLSRRLPYLSNHLRNYQQFYVGE